MDIFIPAKINKFTADKPYFADNIGLSASTVVVFDDMVLKIENHTTEIDKTVDMLHWLSDKISVPKVICYEVYNNKSYTLMTRLKGKMACDKFYMEQSDAMVNIIADGLKYLWNTDITDCPREITFKDDLKNARFFVENNMVDETAVDYSLLAEHGIGNIQQLLIWLENNIPDYEPVLSHGDYCLPNILIENGYISGYIDLGECAVSDKWKDIALCYISLKNNFSGFFGGKIYPDFKPEILFEKLGIKPDWNKLNYWFLLNELFKLK